MLTWGSVQLNNVSNPPTTLESPEWHNL